MERSYAFDPCTIDGSDKKEITIIDSWKPGAKKKDSLVMSQWRLNQNGNSHDLSPGIDELKKISVHLKNKHSDCDIMKLFGISSETLVAIKRGCYCPVDGISLDNQSKIHKEFMRLEKMLDKIKEALIFMFAEEKNFDEFKKKLGIKSKKEKEDESFGEELEDD